MEQEFLTCNQEALAEAHLGHLWEAQTQFQKNAREHPCWITYQNMGAFYAFNGLILRNGRERNADKLAEHYLSKALLFQPDSMTYFTLGHFHYGYRRYSHAASSFGDAFHKEPDWVTAYNCGISFYMEGNYQNALQWLRSILHDNQAEDPAQIASSYAFALFFSGPGENRTELASLLNGTLYQEDWEFWVLATLMGNYAAAADRADAVWKHCCLGMEEMALLFECLQKTGRFEEAEGCFRQQIEWLKDSDYDMKRRIKTLQSVFKDETARAQMIQSFRPRQFLIPQRCFAD